MNTEVRPILLVGAHAQRTLELRVLSALLAWGRDWLPQEMPDPIVEARPASVPPYPAAVPRLYGGEAGRAWVCISDQHDRALAAALLGAAGSSTPKDAVLGPAFAEARRARDRAVAEVLVGPCAEPVDSAIDAGLWAMGSGAVQIECKSIGLSMFVDHGALRHVPPREAAPTPLPSKVPLEHTLSRAAVRVDVELGSVDIELGPLLDLAAGDVIRLPMQLKDHASIKIDGQLVAQGLIGAHDGHRAVQWVAMKGDKRQTR